MAVIVRRSVTFTRGDACCERDHVLGCFCKTQTGPAVVWQSEETNVWSIRGKDPLPQFQVNGAQNHRFNMPNSLRRALYTLAVLPFLSFSLIDVEAGTISVTWEDVGSDLKASWTGTFDISGYNTGANVNGNGVARSQGNPGASLFFIEANVSGTGNLTNYNITSGSAAGPDNFSFNTGSTTTFSGTSFELITGSGTGFNVENGWQNNDPVTGTATWTSTSLSAVFGSNLPLFVSKTMFDDGTNTVTFQAVPEPSAALPALGGAATVLWQVSRRKRPVAQAVACR